MGIKTGMKTNQHNRFLQKRKIGQAILEFTFSIIVILIMAWSTIAIFKWTGADLVGRRQSHDLLLRTGIDEAWSNATCRMIDVCKGATNSGHCIGSGTPFQCTCQPGPACLPACTEAKEEKCQYFTDYTDGPLKQVDPYFYRPIGLNAVWDRN